MRRPWLGALGLAFTSPALAADLPGDTHALPCRPTIACTADIVPPGAFEVEAGGLFRRLGGEERQWSFPFLAKLTVARWLQLQVGSNGATFARGAAPAAFFDDVEAAAKFHLVDQTKLAPSISLSATASIPTAEAQGYVRTFDLSFIAYVTKDFGPLHADLNAGANLWRLEDAPIPQAFVALAVSANLPAPFGVMGEAYYFSDAPPIAPRDGGFLFAISVTPRPWLVFDFGGDVGWFPSTRAFSTFIGVSFVPVLLWGHAPR